MPVTAVHTLNESVLPTFDEHQACIKTVLSDNGRDFCGRPESRPYELFLQIEGIEHRTSRVRRPQSNGFVERLRRTLLDEHFRIMGRTNYGMNTSRKCRSTLINSFIIIITNGPIRAAI